MAIPKGAVDVGTAIAIYNVLNRDGRWRMVINHREFGSFTTEQHAVRIAIEMAHEAGRFKLLGSVVVLHETAEKSRVVWTYGHDPFPPTRFG
jgi:hypothetical protein